MSKYSVLYDGPERCYKVIFLNDRMEEWQIKPGIPGILDRAVAARIVAGLNALEKK